MEIRPEDSVCHALQRSSEDDCLHMMKQYRLDVNSWRSEHGMSLFHVAVTRSFTNCMQYLFEHHYLPQMYLGRAPTLNARDKAEILSKFVDTHGTTEGHYSIHLAVYYNVPVVVDWLVRFASCDTSIRDPFGNDPAAIAKRRGFPNLLPLLEDRTTLNFSLKSRSLYNPREDDTDSTNSSVGSLMSFAQAISSNRPVSAERVSLPKQLYRNPLDGQSDRMEVDEAEPSISGNRQVYDMSSRQNLVNIQGPRKILNIVYSWVVSRPYFADFSGSSTNSGPNSPKSRSKVSAPGVFRLGFSQRPVNLTLTCECFDCPQAGDHYYTDLSGFESVGIRTNLHLYLMRLYLKPAGNHLHKIYIRDNGQLLKTIMVAGVNKAAKYEDVARYALDSGLLPAWTDLQCQRDIMLGIAEDTHAKFSPGLFSLSTRFWNIGDMVNFVMKYGVQMHVDADAQRVAYSTTTAVSNPDMNSQRQTEQSRMESGLSVSLPKPCSSAKELASMYMTSYRIFEYIMSIFASSSAPCFNMYKSGYVAPLHEDPIEALLKTTRVPSNSNWLHRAHQWVKPVVVGLVSISPEWFSTELHDHLGGKKSKRKSSQQQTRKQPCQLEDSYPLQITVIEIPAYIVQMAKNEEFSVPAEERTRFSQAGSRSSSVSSLHGTVSSSSGSLAQMHYVGKSFDSASSLHNMEAQSRLDPERPKGLVPVRSSSMIEEQPSSASLNSLQHLLNPEDSLGANGKSLSAEFQAFRLAGPSEARNHNSMPSLPSFASLIVNETAEHAPLRKTKSNTLVPASVPLSHKRVKSTESLHECSSDLSDRTPNSLGLSSTSMYDYLTITNQWKNVPLPRVEGVHHLPLGKVSHFSSVLSSLRCDHVIRWQIVDSESGDGKEPSSVQYGWRAVPL